MADDVVDREYEEELRQFLEADLLPQAGDPEFKARLRGQLLALLRAQRGDEPAPAANRAEGAPRPSAARASQVDRVPQAAAARATGGEPEPC